MESLELQKQFFDYIKEKLPPHLSLVDEVAEVLGISNDSAYRRIRGEKPIAFEEIRTLCKRFRVSLDHMINITTDSTVFSGSWVEKDGFNFDNHLNDMLFQLEQINKAKVKEFYYEAKDIPPFHHFQFPDLAAFKYFFWMRTILGYDRYQKCDFESHDLTQALMDVGKKIIKTYTQIPSTEIWSIETLNSTLRQIEYYRETGVFKKKESIATLYDEVEKLIKHIQAQAECGEKFLIGEQPSGSTGNFKLFFNEVILGHNTVLAVTDDVKTVFINHAIINYIITRNANFCNQTHQSLNNIIQKSSLISSVSEKERNKFFNALYKKIEARRNNL
ncbi:MAG: hypothetical protein ACHQNT_09795 [Bacteroidia bacterium]